MIKLNETFFLRDKTKRWMRMVHFFVWNGVTFKLLMFANYQEKLKPKQNYYL